MKFIRRKIYKKYGLDYKKINDELIYHIKELDTNLRA